MKTIMIFVLLVCTALSFSSCEEEKTPVTPPPQSPVGWVEITDTVHLPDIHRLVSIYTTWKSSTGLVIQDTVEFLKLATMIDTAKYAGKVDKQFLPQLPEPIDFSKYSMVGLHTQSGYVNYYRKFYVNDSLKQYRYNVGLESLNNRMILILAQNWLRVPRLKAGYTVVFDTTQINY